MHRAKLNDESAATQQQLITYAIVGLVSFSLLSTATWFAFNYSGDNASIDDPMANWVDPVTEIEDDNHSHNDLLAHRLKTSNMQLIDYHNLNCDGEVTPPAELDNVAGRPCYDEFKNVGAYTRRQLGDRYRGQLPRRLRDLRGRHGGLLRIRIFVQPIRDT